MDTLQPNVNTGYLEQEPRLTDFISGVASGILPEIRNPSGNWSLYLPGNEAQIGVYFDTLACVTFSALNVIETQLNFLLATGQIPSEKIAQLAELGVLKDGKFNFSDRFTAKMSGTTKQGNYLVAVWDSIRKDGLLAESDWDYPRDQRQPVFVWEDYYKEIPQELKDKAKKFLDIFDIKYEWLTAGKNATPEQMDEWLKTGPVQIATAVCPPWNTDQIIAGCSLAVGHATTVYRVDANSFDILDHYNPFNKRLGFDYPIPNAMRGMVYVKGQTPTPAPAPIDPAFGKKLAGKLLLAVEDKGSIWYVTPDGKRVKIGRTPEEVAAFLAAINSKKVPVTGINNVDLGKLATV